MWNLKPIVSLIFTLLLTWNDNSTGETGFAVWRKDCNPNGGACSKARKIFTLVPDSTRFYDTGLKHNRVYCYRVSAIFPTQEYLSNEDCARNP